MSEMRNGAGVRGQQVHETLMGLFETARLNLRRVHIPKNTESIITTQQAQTPPACFEGLGYPAENS